MTFPAWVLTIGVAVVLLWVLSGRNETENIEQHGSVQKAAQICAKTRAKVRVALSEGREARWMQTMILEQCERDGL